MSLHARGLALRDALDRLGAQSGVTLAYSSDLLPLDRPVCVVADRQPLGRVLAAKPTLVSGFVRNGYFYTRAAASRAVEEWPCAA